MALGDITIFDDGIAHPGAKRFTVAASAASGNPTIKAGELVEKDLGNTLGKNVSKWAVSAAKPVVATDFIAGVAASTSTETSTAAGVVDIFPNVQGLTYLITPNAPTSWDTQAEYDALVGARVLLNNSATFVQTILASDSATSGLVVEPLNILTYPGKVRFSMRKALNYDA